MSLSSIGFLVVGLILGLMALIGILGALKGTPVRRVKPYGGGERPAVHEPVFRDTMESLIHAQMQRAHEVEIFINGDQTYPRLWEDLRAARESITVQLYYCEEGKMADTFRDILIERVKAGVKVLFLVDAFGSTLKKEWVEVMEKAGVETCVFRPLRLWYANTIQHRSHARVICIDGEIGYTGGFGLADKWYGDGRSKDQWRDSNVRFTGPAVRQLQATFVACWGEAAGELLVGDMLFPPPGPPKDEGVLAAILHARPSVGSTDAERFYALSTECAREHFYLTNSYFVPDRDFRGMLCAAAKRGVDVRILTAGPSTDVKSTLYAGRANYEELLKSGVRIYEYRDTMMHAKTLVMDGKWGAVGSMNADNRSMSFNEETMLLVLDDDVGATLERQFMEDLKYADEIDLKVFCKRGFMDRCKEQGTHLIRRVL
ncbi:MAG: phospholipase D-like domain-containing protein [Gemmatimonadaceae bacterium]